MILEFGKFRQMIDNKSKSNKKLLKFTVNKIFKWIDSKILSI